MIAVISDSHVPHRADEIPEEFLEIIEEAEKVVHCGDFETREVHDRIESLSKEFFAVKGNCDRFEIDLYESFESDGIKFGVYHGSKIHPRGHEPALSRTAEQMNVEVLFHGHTHQQDASIHEGKILLNPGSCTGVGGATSTEGNPEMMKVRVEDKLKVEMLELGDEVRTVEEKSFEL